MFGFLPKHVDDSLMNLIVYNAFPVEVKFDSNGAMKSNWPLVKDYFSNWLKYICILGMYSSILLAYDYQPYPNSEGPALTDIHVLHGFTPKQLLNNASVASKFSMSASSIHCTCPRLT